MQNVNITSTQSLMDRYYEEEKAQQERELTLAALNVHLDASDLAMLNVISKRFRKTRDEVAQELLSNALIDLFSRLETGERKLLARDADDAARSIAEDIAEDNGVRNVEIKTGVWANHERQFTKLERKLAKLAAQEEEAEPEKTEGAYTHNGQVQNEAEAANSVDTEAPLETEQQSSEQTDAQQSVASMLTN